MVLGRILRKPNYTFKNLIKGEDCKCKKCKKYVHPDLFNSLSNICDNCGINAFLTSELERVSKK